VTELFHNKVLKDTITEKFAESVNLCLLPFIKEKYGENFLGILMYEDYLSDNFCNGGVWYYPLTVRTTEGTFTEWILWDISDTESFKDGIPYSYVGEELLTFAFASDVPEEFVSALSCRAIDYDSDCMTVTVHTPALSPEKLSGKYSQTFLDELAKQITRALSRALAVEGLKDSTLELSLVLADGTYMEHTSDNVTYRRLLLTDKGCQARDFWVKWTRLDGAVSYSVTDNVSAESIQFELGEDVPQKIREKEFRFLCGSNPNKYQSAMGKRTVTEWRELIKRAVRRGDLVKTKSDLECAEHSAAVSDRLTELLGSIGITKAPEQTTEETTTVHSSDFERAMALARAALDEQAREQEEEDEPPFSLELEEAADEPEEENALLEDEPEEELAEEPEEEIEEIEEIEKELEEEPEESSEPEAITYVDEEKAAREAFAKEAAERLAKERAREEEALRLAEERARKEAAEELARQREEELRKEAEARIRAEAEARIRAEVEAEARLKYEAEARQRAEEETRRLREENERLLAIAREAKERQERLEEERLAEAERLKAEAEERRIEQENLRARLEEQSRRELLERERIAAAAREALMEKERLERERAEAEERARQLAIQREQERLALEEERRLEEARIREEERLRREAAERAAQEAAAAKEAAERARFIERQARILFRRKIDLNVIKEIKKTVEKTLRDESKEHVQINMRAQPVDDTVITLDVKLPASEEALLIKLIKAIGNSGIGITKITLESK